MNTIPYERILLRLEGAVLLLLALGAYFYGAFSWLIFVAVFLGVDIVLLLYLVSSRAGAQAYALSHNLTLPVIIFIISMVISWPLGYAVALALLTRAAVDRLFAVMHTPPYFLSSLFRIKNMSPLQNFSSRQNDETPRHAYSMEEYERMKSRGTSG